MENNPIAILFLKQLAKLCLKQLERIINKAANIFIAFMCKQQFPGMLLYLLTGAGILLLLSIAGRSIYYRHCQSASLHTTDIRSRKITIKVGDRTVPIHIPPATGVPYIRLDMDSILHELLIIKDIDCNEAVYLNVPAGSPPVLTMLPDSTLVYLNAASSLRWPTCFAGNKRQVYLQGEACFEVAPDAFRMFIVHTRQLTVKAVGTRFNVKCYPDSEQTFVSLLEGKVLVTSEGKETGIPPGHTAVLDHSSRQLEIAPCSERLVLSWQKNMYFFNGEPLMNICSTLSRAYGIRIIIDNGRTGNQRFSGSINYRHPLQRFLDYIKDAGGVENYYDSKGQLHLK